MVVCAFDSNRKGFLHLMREKFFVMHILCKVTAGIWSNSDLNEAATRFAGGEVTREQLAANGIAMLDACDPSAVERGGMFEGWHDECTDGTHDHIACSAHAGWFNE